MFIMLSVLEGTQRVPPTCIIKTDFTYPRALVVAVSIGGGEEFGGAGGGKTRKYGEKME